MSNNGLITKIWGPGGWLFLHSVTFGYPDDPTDEQKKSYEEFFRLVGDILPCKYCRDSYKEFIVENDTKLEEAMKDRDSLTKWLYLIHEKVNNKLGVTYGVEFEDVQRKYEAYRAKCSKDKQLGCITPLNLKAESYKHAYSANCAIIPYATAKKFVNYAKLIGLKDKNFYLIRTMNKDKDLEEISRDKCCNIWCKRDDECRKIIKKMRLEGIESLDKNGFPTKEELRLIMRFCSNLPNDELLRISKKLPKIKKRKTYKLFMANQNS